MIIKTIKTGGVNSYIVQTGEGAILIDTGRKKYRNKLLKECQSANVNSIILTHGHVDHAGNAAYLAEQLHIPVFMNEKDFDLLKDNFMQPIEAKSFFGKIVLALSLKSFREEKIELFKPALFLSEGDKLDEYGVDGTIIELSGHTKGSIGVQIGDKVFVGDALMNQIKPSISLLYNDEKAMKDSAIKISKLGKVTIYFGHGKPVLNRVWIK